MAEELDQFVNTQYANNSEEKDTEKEENGVVDFIGEQYGWWCSCGGENAAEDTVCRACGAERENNYEVEGYVYDNGVYYDENGGWFDENGLYHDASGGWYDQDGLYHDANGGHWDAEGQYHDAEGGYYDVEGVYHMPEEENESKKKKWRPPKKHTVCQTCFHRHYWGEFCHVFYEEDIDLEPTADEKSSIERAEKEEKKYDMFAVDSDDDDSGSGFEGSDLSDEGGQSDEDSEARVLRQLNEARQKKLEKSAAAEGALGLPRCVEKCGFVRCNCRDGIKEQDFDYVPLPKPYMAGFIRVMTYEVQKEKEHTLYRELNAAETLAYCKKLNKEIVPFIPHILSFLPVAQCAPTAIACKLWNKGAEEYSTYRDMRDVAPWNVFRPHSNQTDAVLRVGDKIYSGGDRRVYISDVNTGEQLHMMTRDTGIIPTLLKVEDSIYCLSCQGAIRVFNLMHNVKRIHLDLTMWEHSRRITEVAFEPASDGNCALHGIENHCCRMYTVSEDRMIVVWDTVKHCPVKNIKPRMLKDQVINSICMSDRHFFCGTSGGTVLVFSKANACDREDIHNCLVAVKDLHNEVDDIGRVTDPAYGASIDRTWCLQLTLRIPNTRDFADNIPSVNVVMCCNSGADAILHCGDSTGRHTMWKMPETGLDYVPIKTYLPHTRSLNIMKQSMKHIITASDDGTIVFMETRSLSVIRRIDVLKWALDKNLIHDDSANIPREIKCMHLFVDNENGGTLTAGTSYGDIIVMNIGTTI